MAGFRGDTDDAMEVPPEDFLDSLEAINIRNYQRMFFFSEGAFILLNEYFHTTLQIKVCGYLFLTNVE